MNNIINENQLDELIHKAILNLNHSGSYEEKFNIVRDKLQENYSFENITQDKYNLCINMLKNGDSFESALIVLR